MNNNFSKFNRGWSDVARRELEELEDQFNSSDDPAVKRSIYRKIQVLDMKESNRIDRLNQAGR